MTAAGLRVLAPGLHTTVQDLGRPGYQAIGVPPSGALDGFSLRLANALVRNALGAPALEILLSGPTLEVAADTVRVALVGTDASLAIGAETARILAAGQSVTLSRGEVFQVIAGHGSACCYLAAESPPRAGSPYPWFSAAPRLTCAPRSAGLRAAHCGTAISCRWGWRAPRRGPSCACPPR